MKANMKYGAVVWTVILFVAHIRCSSTALAEWNEDEFKDFALQSCWHNNFSELDGKIVFDFQDASSVLAKAIDFEKPRFVQEIIKRCPSVKSTNYSFPVLSQAIGSFECDIDSAVSSAERKDRKLAMLKLLVQEGVSVDLRDGSNQETALHYAADQGFVEAMRMLLGAQANPNAKGRGSHGLTPLEKAVFGRASEEQKIEMVQLLVDAGADISVMNRYRVHEVQNGAPGMRRNSLDVLKALQQAGAVILER